ncbi:MAG: hypothetical protein EOP04_20215 [Proteobacteria bacterium]|nr:MAG: hypothetical protein EOP04_20215 [Pseudomonadota bacterium]
MRKRCARYVLILSIVFIGCLLPPNSRAVFPIAPKNTLVSECNSLFHDVDFIPSQEAIQKLKLPIQVLSTSVRIAQGGYSCSANTVADDGTLLTAGHCLEVCFPKEAFGRAGVAGGSKPLMLVTKEMIGQICNVQINGVENAYKIIAAQGCQVLPGLDLKKSEMAACGEVPDYAVLKPLFPARGNPCLKSANKKPEEGAPIALIGFPNATNRKKNNSSARDSNGRDQYISLGSVENKFDCNVPSPSALGWLGVGGKKNSIFDGKIALRRYIQVSADAVHGNSGGSLLDDRGETLGVLSQSFEDKWQEEHCQGGSFVTPISMIRKDLIETFGQDPDQLFKCERSAAVR